MRALTAFKWVSLALVLILASACQSTPDQSSAGSTVDTEVSSQAAPAANTQPAQETPEAQETSASEADIDETPTQPLPDPLDNLLAIRPLKISLNAALPDGTSRSMEVEIDPVGNMVVRASHPQISVADLPEGITLPKESITTEIYVIDGLVYSPTEDDPDWKNSPVEMDYGITLSDQIHGFEGFSTWLDMLPAGSLTAAGDELVGGFATAKYLVNGQVGGQAISGALWYDQATHSLVKAELHVPAALTSNPEAPESGETFITLLAENTEVSPISLPSN